jgi:hypothetical protein
VRSLEAGGGRLDFELAPGATLEVAVLPVHARLTFRDVREGSTATPLLVGGLRRSVPGEPVTLSAGDQSWDQKPAPETGALRVWLDQRRRNPDRVELDDETRERLRALGYTM